MDSGLAESHYLAAGGVSAFEYRQYPDVLQGFLLATTNWVQSNNTHGHWCRRDFGQSPPRTLRVDYVEVHVVLVKAALDRAELLVL